MAAIVYDYRKGQNNVIHDTSTNVMYLLGTAGDGPVMEPLKITKEEDLLSAFGDQGSIPKAWSLINQSIIDCEIIGCKVVGLHSKCHLNFNVIGKDIIEDAIEIAAVGASHLYDEVEIVITSDYIEFNAPISLGGSSNRYMFDDFKVLGLLMRRINYDAEHGIGIVYMNSNLHPYTELFGGLYSVNPESQRMYGGYNGLDASKEEMYFALQDAYEMLESINISVIVPVDCFMDDVHPRYLIEGGDYMSSILWDPTKKYLDYEDENGPVSFHRQLIDFCKKQLYFGIATIGIMGMNKFKDLLLKQSENPFYVTDYIRNTSLGVGLGFAEFDKDQPSGQDGRYISIICGDILYNNGIIENGYLTFATMLASSYSNLSLTNEKVTNVQLSTVFSTEDLEFMDHHGLTSFRISPLNGLVVSNAVSVTDPKSEYHYLCNTRMIQLFLAKVHEALGIYVGERIDILEKDKVIESKIDDIIVLTKEEGVIKDATYSVNYDKSDGSIQIEFDLKALYMIESVKAYKGG